MYSHFSFFYECIILDAYELRLFRMKAWLHIPAKAILLQQMQGYILEEK